MKRCKCGHAEDEHAQITDFPSCLVDGCSCPGFEEDPEGEPEPDLIVGENEDANEDANGDANEERFGPLCEHERERLAVLLLACADDAERDLLESLDPKVHARREQEEIEHAKRCAERERQSESLDYVCTCPPIEVPEFPFLDEIVETLTNISSLRCYADRYKRETESAK